MRGVMTRVTFVRGADLKINILKYVGYTEKQPREALALLGGTGPASEERVNVYLLS